jgi:hypothetical protein
MKFQVHIEGFTFDGECWRQPGFTTRYAAQLTCPVKDCGTFYTAEQKGTMSKAQSDVKGSMRRHLKKKHR